jgi:Na+/H+ antiporter NhaC
MPLNARTSAISIAVVLFFVIVIVGWLNGLDPFTCCKRAIAGAISAYFIAILAVKAINAVLINAIIKNQVDKQKENQQQ